MCGESRKNLYIREYEMIKYYLKNAVLPFVYLFFMAITAFGILAIQNDSLVWLKYVLLALNLGLYLFIVAAYAYKLGQDALKTRNSNDLERKHMVLTGELRPLKENEEYKPHKGFIIGLTSCVPLIILMIIHTIMILCGGGNGFGVAASMVYLAFYAFFRVGGAEAPSPATFYFTLIALPVIVATCGIAYYLGAKKIQNQYDKIAENQKRIYGE